MYIKDVRINEGALYVHFTLCVRWAFWVLWLVHWAFCVLLCPLSILLQLATLFPLCRPSLFTEPSVSTKPFVSIKHSVSTCPCVSFLSFLCPLCFLSLLCFQCFRAFLSTSVMYIHPHRCRKHATQKNIWIITTLTLSLSLSLSCSPAGWKPIMLSLFTQCLHELPVSGNQSCSINHSKLLCKIIVRHVCWEVYLCMCCFCLR